MATLDDVRAAALVLPRTYEQLVREWIKFKVGRLVYAAVSPDETVLGFGFPKEERAALIASDPVRFLMPARADERYRWVQARLPLLGVDEVGELVLDAWCMVVPKRLAAEQIAGISKDFGSDSAHSSW
jgi:hypothetical protein